MHADAGPRQPRRARRQAQRCEADARPRGGRGRPGRRARPAEEAPKWRVDERRTESEEPTGSTGQTWGHVARCRPLQKGQRRTKARTAGLHPCSEAAGGAEHDRTAGANEPAGGRLPPRRAVLAGQKPGGAADDGQGGKRGRAGARGGGGGARGGRPGAEARNARGHLAADERRAEAEGDASPWGRLQTACARWGPDLAGGPSGRRGGRKARRRW